VADEASSGPAALEALRAAVDHDPYRVVLLDMQMPEMDGAMTARAIQQEPRIADVQLILLSSIATLGTAAEMRRMGFAAALTKPVRQSHLFNVVGMVAGNVAAAAPQPTPAPGRDVGLGLRILVAEDNPVNQKVVVAMLSRLGCRATVVVDGAQAVAAIARDSYDVVLMDVQMPEMDGLQATAQIRLREAQTGRHQAIIAMTAHALEGDRERCLAAGMDGYVAKPLKLNELATAIQPYGAAGCAAPSARGGGEPSGGRSGLAPQPSPSRA
jgi:CheY-like chemotaxis protein